MFEVYCRPSRLAHAQTLRSAARNTGSSNSEDHRPRAAPWLGYRQTHSTPLWGRAGGRARIFVSGAPPTLTTRLDHSGLEGFGYEAVPLSFMSSLGRARNNWSGNSTAGTGFLLLSSFCSRAPEGRTPCDSAASCVIVSILYCGAHVRRQNCSGNSSCISTNSHGSIRKRE